MVSKRQHTVWEGCLHIQIELSSQHQTTIYIIFKIIKNKKYDHIVDLNIIYNASAMHSMIKFNNHATNFFLRQQHILLTTLSRRFNSFTQIPPLAPSHSRLSLNLLHNDDLLFFNLNRVSSPFFRRQMFFFFSRRMQQTVSSSR